MPHPIPSDAFANVDWSQTNGRIAKALGVCHSTVWKERKRLGIPAYTGPRPRQPRGDPGEAYYAVLLEFREWCAARDTPFVVEARKALLAWINGKLEENPCASPKRTTTRASR